jgi:hypothetical protein
MGGLRLCSKMIIATLSVGLTCLAMICRSREWHHADVGERGSSSRRVTRRRLVPTIRPVQTFGTPMSSLRSDRSAISANAASTL